MFGRQNLYFPQRNVLPIEENATGSRNSAGGGGEHRVIRSEVWSRFRLEGLNAICMVCNEKLKVGPTRQTSSLWRHLKRHNRMPSQNQRVSPGYHHQQSQLYAHQQQQPQMLRRSNNAFAMNDDGIRQHQQSAILSHGLRALPLHHLRLQQQQQQQGIRMPPTALLHNHFRHNLRHAQPSCSSSCCSTTAFAHQQQQRADTASSPPPSSAVHIPLTHPPMVTVDCKPVKNRALDQLLGIRREEEEEGEEEGEQQQEAEETINSSRRVVEEDEFMLNDDMGEEGEGAKGMIEEEEEEEEDDENGAAGREWELARTLTEFILENGLPFHRLLLSSTFSALLHLNQSVPKSLPSPAFLLQRIVPKLFADTLEERKMRFNDDFFVLILNKIELDSPKQTALLSVTAQKLSDCFALCSRSLGQFAIDCSNPSGMANALRHCFEEGSVRLHLWQISAIVHDGGADAEELCHQLDVPGIPSIHSLIRRTYTELDKLEFPPEFVTRLKKRFETAVDEVKFLNGNSPTDAFAILMPPLIDRIDRFFREEEQKAEETVAADEAQEGIAAETKDEKNCGGNGPVPIHRLEQRLLAKFQLLWTFQRRKLVEMETALMTLFLNPSNLCGSTKNGGGGGQEEGFFGESKWQETAERVREQISQVCEDGADNAEEAESGAHGGTKTALLREDVQSEVTNYMNTARLELGHSSSGNTVVDPSSASSPLLAAHFNSLAELLFWWRINAERFPRLVQLARQFCAVPISNGDQWKSVGEGDDSAAEEETEREGTRRYAAQLMARESGDTVRLESGRTEQLQLLTQLMTVRMALRERTTHANAFGEEPNECNAVKKEGSYLNSGPNDDPPK